jgi:hypothetical protein
MGVGFPLFLMGTLILFAQGTSPAVVILACAMVLVGLGLFFDPR